MPYTPNDQEDMPMGGMMPDEQEKPGQPDTPDEESGEVEQDDGTLLPSGLDAGVVSYYEHPEGFGCGRCVFFDGEQQACAVVDGIVTERGCCDLWEDDSSARYTGPKLTKEAVVYLEGQSPSNSYVCGECRFMEQDGTCAVVGGQVSKDTGTCTQWSSPQSEPAKPTTGQPSAPPAQKRVVRRGPVGAGPQEPAPNFSGEWQKVGAMYVGQ